MLTERELERFWPKVDVRGVWECWPWTATHGRGGYGRLRAERRGSHRAAHRVMWEATHGEIPAGLCVCHSCDNKLCVNPRHLYLATKAENNADKGMEGRYPRGEAHPAAKLTRGQVLEIRRRLAEGETQAALGRRFGVTCQAVWAILHGKRWTWLEEE